MPFDNPLRNQPPAPDTLFWASHLPAPFTDFGAPRSLAGASRCCNATMRISDGAWLYSRAAALVCSVQRAVKVGGRVHVPHSSPNVGDRRAVACSAASEDVQWQMGLHHRSTPGLPPPGDAARGVGSCVWPCMVSCIDQLRHFRCDILRAHARLTAAISRAPIQDNMSAEGGTSLSGGPDQNVELEVSSEAPSDPVLGEVRFWRPRRRLSGSQPCMPSNMLQ